MSRSSTWRSILGFFAVLVVFWRVERSRRASLEKESPPSTADHVDLSRYVGKWFEIARIPYGPERGCHASTAEYAIDNGNLRVVNACRQGSLQGPTRKIEGKARVVDPATNAKLKVRLGFFATGDYWILDVDPDYNYALVGTPDRDKLWILSRMPALDEYIYRRLVAKASANGFDTSRLVRTPQPSTGAVTV